MCSIKWFMIFIFASNWKEEEAVCKHEWTSQPQDLFACESTTFRPNSSTIISDGVATVIKRNRRDDDNDNSQNRTIDQTILCSSSSRQYPYLQIKFKYYYDVCKITTWTNISNFTDTNFKIELSYSGHKWYDYMEMRQVKDFQGVRNNTNVSSHHVHLTTKYIRFRPVNWDKGSCLQFAIHGDIASCESSQRRMDLWCRNISSHRYVRHRNCSGYLRARFDRNQTSSKKLWRCYYESALKSDLSGYNDTLNSSCYETRPLRLKRVSKSCTNASTIKCELPTDGANKTEGKMNISESKANFTQELIANFTQSKEVKELTAQMSSSDILEVVHLLENVLPDKLLRNTTQYYRDQIAKTFLGISSTLFNETNNSTWSDLLSNSTTLSRLLKVVEDFGVAFTKYLECDNKTENGKTFSFSNIKFIAKSFVNTSTFPMKLFSSQGCDFDNDSSDACNTWSDLIDNAIIPEPLLDEHQQWQVSFVSYKNAHKLFPVESTKGNVHLRSVKVDSRIMSLSVKPDGLVFKENPMVIALKSFSHNSQNENDFHCGFWNFSIAGTPNGAWSTDGCSVLSINTSQVTCRCTHLTNFALLLQVTPDSKLQTQGTHKEVLKWMTYLGCSLSLVAEILCLLAFILLTDRKETTVKIHINLVACLAVGHLVFLTGVEKAVGWKVVCSIVAVSLHFFFLASFMWMLVEGIYLLSKVKTVFQPMNNLGIAYALAYGLPLLIVGGTFGIKFNEYGTLKHCWLSVSSGTIWSFIGPVCCIILVNIIVLVFVLYMLTNTRIFSRKSEWQKIRLTVRASLVMVPLLGLSWFFGLMAINQDTIVFQYIFVGLNSLQGVFLFLFQCVVHEQVKASLRNTLRRRRVTQQVTRVVSKARSNEHIPQDRHKQRLSLPGITVTDRHVKVVQSVRLTKVRGFQDSREYNGGDNNAYGPEKVSVTSIKFAWGKTASI